MSPKATRLIAAFLLCLHGWLSTPVASFAFASLATWSGEHEVRFQIGATGPRIVLHHLPQKLTLRAEEHTRALTRVLSTICQINSQGDHIFDQPSAVSSITETQRPLKTEEPARHSSPMLAPLTASAPGLQAISAQVATIRLTASKRSARPTASHGTIVLLI
jgi:hypothetical protein